MTKGVSKALRKEIRAVPQAYVSKKQGADSKCQRANNL